MTKKSGPLSNLSEEEDKDLGPLSHLSEDDTEDSNKAIEQIKDKILNPKERGPQRIPARDLLSTGSTLLNLACSGRIQGGLPKGKYIHLVGDSGSGKTWLAHTALAEAAINPRFDDYKFYYNAPEDGALMDKAFYFGQKAADRIIPIYSKTVEEMYYDIKERLAEGPCIYIEDSMDALEAEADQEKFAKQKKAAEDDMDAKGTYGTAKAKCNSRNLPWVTQELRETESILVIISQTRDSIRTFGFGKKKTVSGGRSLKFYATLEMWLSVTGTINKKYKGKDRQIGIKGYVDIEKNRVTGWERDITIPILHSVGVDDVGSCVDYLVDENHWTKNKAGVITAKELEVELRREDLIKHLEDGDMHKELTVLVGQVWHGIENAIKVKRKSRYE